MLGKLKLVIRKFQSFVSPIFTYTEYKVIGSSLDSGVNLSREFIVCLLDGSINSPFKCKNRQYVHRIELQGKIFYLKRTTHEPSRNILRRIVRGQKAYTNSGNIFIALQVLKTNNHLVMEPVAMAEERWFGVWPRRGFVLVKGVMGEELIDIIKNTEASSKRTKSLRLLGKYLGQLHGDGYYHAARVHDFILVPKTVRGRDDFELCMIDPDFYGRSCEKESFDMNRAIEAIANAFYLFLRVGHCISLSELRQLIIGYSQGIRIRGGQWQSGSLRKILIQLDVNLSDHYKDSRLTALFPITYISMAEMISDIS